MTEFQTKLLTHRLAEVRGADSIGKALERGWEPWTVPEMALREMKVRGVGRTDMQWCCLMWAPLGEE